jgi:hypothetical protein
MVDLLQIARAEWHRERPAVRAYVRVVMRFVAAYILVAAASM